MNGEYIGRIAKLTVPVLRRLVSRCGGRATYKIKGGKTRYHRKDKLIRTLRGIYQRGAFEHRATIEAGVDRALARGVGD